MKPKKSVPPKEIIFSSLAVTFWIIFGLILSLSRSLIVEGFYKPHETDDASGLLGVFGGIGLIISCVPLVLATVFTIVSLILVFKRKRRNNSKMGSDLITPNTT